MILKFLLGFFYLVGIASALDGKFISKNPWSTIKESNGDALLQTGYWSSLTQPLDHFNNTETTTFDQRFYVIAPELRTSSSPLFVILGGQLSLDLHLPAEPDVVKMARSQNAYLVVLEHRYYGQSTPDLSLHRVQNLRWLTVEQTLADVDRFIDFARRNLTSANARVILGGSRFGGSLAVWYRQRYPASVSGVWALSAPLLARIHVPTYFEAVGEQIRRVGGDACFDRVQTGIQRAEALHSNRSFTQFEQEFRVCNASCPACLVHILNIFVALQFSLPAQTGRDDGLLPLCAELNRHPLEQALGNFFHTVFEPACFHMLQNYFPQYFRDVNNRVWAYQQCTGLGWVPSTESRDQPFGTEIPIEFFYNACNILFGSKFTRENINSWADQFNEQYGGLRPNVTNVLFVNGDNDPYRALNVRASPRNGNLVVNIPGRAQISEFSSIADVWPTVAEFVQNILLKN